MADEKVLQEVKRRCQDRYLPCGLAFQIAEDLGVTPLLVGQAANQLGIKIVNCQLGCFGDKRAKPKP